MSTRPQMWMDAALPRTHRVPVHPETWAGMTEEQRQYFDLKTAEERVFVMPEGTTMPPYATLKQEGIYEHEA